MQREQRHSILHSNAHLSIHPCSVANHVHAAHSPKPVLCKGIPNSARLSLAERGRPAKWLQDAADVLARSVRLAVYGSGGDGDDAVQLPGSKAGPTSGSHPLLHQAKVLSPRPKSGPHHPPALAAPEGQPNHNQGSQQQHFLFFVYGEIKTPGQFGRSPEQEPTGK